MTSFGPDVKLHPSAFIHDTALVHGKVSIGEGVGLWPYSVIRAEVNEVHIGRCTNIQDFVMIHTGWDSDTVVGEFCSITHHVTLHGCTIGDNVLIGINATIMDGVKVGDNCVIAGGAFITEGTIIPENCIVAGVPAEVKRIRNSFVSNRLNALAYLHNAECYKRGNYRAWAGDDFRTKVGSLQDHILDEYYKRYGP